MNDEEYVFRSESRDKAITARSARKRRTHNGKGGRVKFPSDYLTKKELKAMSGSVESYRLNDPMKWDEFKKMPDDLKRDYIKLIRERFNVPDRKIADMMDVHPITLSNFLKTLGCNKGIHYSKKLKFDEGGWYAWVNNMPMPEKEEPPVTEAIPEEPKKEEKNHAVPDSGTMTFEGRIEDIANTLIHLLGGAKVHIGIQWDVMED